MTSSLLDGEEPSRDEVARSYGYDSAEELEEAEESIDLEGAGYEELRRYALIVGVPATQTEEDLREAVAERRDVLERRVRG